MKPRVQFISFTLLLYAIAFPLFFIEQSLFSASFVVTSENDSGPGTLRQAILDLNSSGSESEVNSITFNNNVTTITLLAPLPSIDNSVTIDGLTKTMILCNTLSPIDEPEQFSSLISITIDGSQIPKTGSSTLAGLIICADDVTVRGLRLSNFTNTEDAQVAGIVTAAHSTLIECCEVTNLTGNQSSSFFTIIGIQGNNDTIISNCFVHNLNSRNKIANNSNVFSGSILGIGSFKTAHNCRVECLKSGNISYTNTTGSDSIRLSTGTVTGITNKQAITLSCNQPPPAKNCPCSIDYEGSECTFVENCIVNHCKSGSILATENARVIIQPAGGIDLSQVYESVIDSCTVCNIQSGDATLLDGIFALRNTGVFGIATLSTNTCIKNNTVHTIYRGAVEISGPNSCADLQSSVGIIADFQTAAAENNIVSNIVCQKVVANGFCTAISDVSCNLQLEPSCIGKLVSPLLAKAPIACGIYFNQGDTACLCNNTITSINAGRRIASGEKALIKSGYSAGMWVNGLQEIRIEDNDIHDIFGSKMSAAPGSSGIFGDIGSKGIALWSIECESDDHDFIITAKRNSIERVCEQSLQTSAGLPGEYINLKNPLALESIFRPSAKTAGISIKTNKEINLNQKNITVENNTIKNITGATVHGGASGLGTMAVGISVETAATISSGSAGGSQLSQQQLCLNIKDSLEPSTILSNTIENIQSGSKNASYGILLDGTNSAIQSIDQSNKTLPLLFSIENNNITNIAGFGSPQQTEALLPNDSCGTNNQNLTCLVPFPYEPTSGVYSIFGNCSIISGNTITHVTDPYQNARGITTQASSDIEMSFNTISKINGYGIFVGGATASVNFVSNNFGLFTQAQFEDIFASTRNKIYSNSTFDNTKQGISLGIIDWNNYFHVSETQCEGTLAVRTHQETPEDAITIIGNHGQVSPCIEKVSINADTVTIDVLLKDTKHIFTNFIIQFFVNNSSFVPHGQNSITDLNDPQFVMTTNINGTAVQRFTFTPTHLVNKTDTISAHVTIADQQPAFVNDQEKGDTSEFAQQQKNISPYPIACHTKPKPYSFMEQLCG